MLREHWRKLRQAVALRGQDLEDRWNFLEFLQRADHAEAWIQEMVRPSWAGAKRGWGCWAERWGQGRACSSPGGSPSGKFPKPPPVPTLLQGLVPWCWGSEHRPQTLTPRPPQEVMVNLGDLGQDLEHCLQLRRRLRRLPGVWAQVRGPCWGRGQSACPHGGQNCSEQPPSMGEGRAPPAALCLLPAPASAGALVSPRFSIFKMGITAARR